MLQGVLESISGDRFFIIFLNVINASVVQLQKIYFDKIFPQFKKALANQEQPSQ